MQYRALIQNRKSVREFKDKQVPAAAQQTLVDYCRSGVSPLLPEVKTELQLFGTEARQALEGAAGYHQFLVGAPQYLVLLSQPHPLAQINAGYIMEELILKLTELELDSCWMTFTDSEAVKAALGIESDLEVAAVAAYGYGKRTARRLRLNIRSMSNIDTAAKRGYMEPKRSVFDLAYLEQWGNRQGMEEHIGFFDDMLWEALYAASLSPSYLNRQAYGFVLHQGQITLVARPDDYNTAIDGALSLGVVLRHFTAVAQEWAGKLTWRFGEQAAELPLPEGHQVIATCSL